VGGGRGFAGLFVAIGRAGVNQQVNASR
jgi:hypothetical protein